MKLTLPPAILFPIHAGNSARPARAALAGLLLFLSAAAAGAVELPAPEALERESGQARRVLEVAEPHATTPEEMVRVGYVALPMAPLLTHWFGEDWKAPAAEVVFQARDGYRSALPGSKLAGGSAFLAFARADGRPFEVDNREQNEKVPLGPYYLIWDNLGTRELLSQGSSGWPYQVDRIELRQSGHDRLPLPPGADAKTTQGLADTQALCLTCHKLRGIGGDKVPEDLTQSLCRWNEADLQRWIDDPARLRPGTAMPGMSRMRPEPERQALIGSISHYLEAVERSDPAACAAVKP